jgi:hypothetical protein
MGRPILNQELAAMLADMSRRLDTIERSARVPKVSNALSGAQYATVSTAQSTNSTSYTNLATVGPSATVPITASGRLLILFSFTGVSLGAGVPVYYVAPALTGANTIPAADANSRGGFSTGALYGERFVFFAGLAAGETTVTLRYRVETAANAEFADRRLCAIPF